MKMTTQVNVKWTAKTWLGHGFSSTTVLRTATKEPTKTMEPVP